MSLTGTPSRADPMAPAFYHHWPSPVDDYSKKRVPGFLRKPRWLVLVLCTLALVLLLIYFGVLHNCKGSQEEISDKLECRNGTHLLQHQLTQSQKILQETESQVDTLNRTVVTLKESLDLEMAQNQKLQNQSSDLQREISRLKELLKEANVNKGTDLPLEMASFSSRAAFSPWVVTGLLLLGLGAP